MAAMRLPRWTHGDVVVRRELIGLGFEATDEDDPVDATASGAAVWFGYPVFVVADTDDELVTYVAPGNEFGFVDDRWPATERVHPWRDRPAWSGHGCLMVQRPGEPYAIWHFWQGEDRAFLCWYVNFQAPFRRTAAGYDTQDFELDIVVLPDGSWTLKDLELMPARVDERHLTQDVADRVVRLGEELAAELDAGRHRWDDRWAAWTPPPAWHDAALPPGWRAEAGTPDERDGPSRRAT
jgi:hypothetical protein